MNGVYHKGIDKKRQPNEYLAHKLHSCNDNRQWKMRQRLLPACTFLRFPVRLFLQLSDSSRKGIAAVNGDHIDQLAFHPLVKEKYIPGILYIKCVIISAHWSGSGRDPYVGPWFTEEWHQNHWSPSLEWIYNAFLRRPPAAVTSRIISAQNEELKIWGLFLWPSRIT